MWWWLLIFDLPCWRWARQSWSKIDEQPILFPFAWL
jgi:hypothetical protein